MEGVNRSYVRIPAGEIHYAEAGTGDPILLLHQTPRSWREYEHVIPLLAPHRRVIAMDTIGYGESTNGTGTDSIETYARAVTQFLDAIEVDHAPVVGHHTGGVIALELAAAWPDRVDALVLSCTPHTNDAHRAKPYKPVDDVSISEDGTHAARLWQKRQQIYPPDRPDLLTAFLIDALKARHRAAEGHRAVTSFRAEDKLPLVDVPTLLIAGTGDPCYPDQEALAAALGGAPIVEIEDGMCPLPEQFPEEFSDAILAFLAEAKPAKPAAT